jgi:hypothetical protein
MNKLRKDQWTTSPNSVTSFFKLPLIDGLSPTFGTGALNSGNCGFGWRFISATHTTIDSLWGSNDKTRLDIEFDPHLIALAEFETLTITVKTDSLVAVEEASYRVLFPMQNRLSLGSYTSLDNFTGDAIVEIQVVFPESLELSFPNELPSQRVRKVLDGSLIGRHMIDTKFCLFTRRTASLRPACPEVIFASSALLLGYSSYLDNREYPFSLSDRNFVISYLQYWEVAASQNPSRLSLILIFQTRCKIANMTMNQTVT